MMSEARSLKTEGRNQMPVLYRFAVVCRISRASASFSGRKGKGARLICQFVTKEIMWKSPAFTGCGKGGENPALTPVFYG